MKIGRVLGLGLVVLVAIALAAVMLRLQVVPSARTLTYEVGEVADVKVLTDARAIQRGEHVNRAIAVCQLCHGTNLGGKLAFEHPILGKGYTPNLTTGEGGIGKSYSVTDWVRAIRHGVNPEGKGLLFMPSDHYTYLTDRDLGAMIGYFKSLPPVNNTRSHLELTTFAKLMIDLGLSGEVVRAKQIDHLANPSASFNGQENSAAYLIEVSGCTFCHGRDLQGGQGLEPGAPPGPDITAVGLKAWDFNQFTTVMRTGLKPDNSTIDYRFMPWLGYQYMTDTELRAVWDYLTTLPTSMSASEMKRSQ
jgi:cytochrome c553